MKELVHEWTSEQPGTFHYEVGDMCGITDQYGIRRQPLFCFAATEETYSARRWKWTDNFYRLTRLFAK